MNILLYCKNSNKHIETNMYRIDYDYNIRFTKIHIIKFVLLRYETEYNNGWEFYQTRIF